MEQLSMGQCSTDQSMTDQGMTDKNMTEQLESQRLAFTEITPALREEWMALLAKSTRPSIYAAFDYIELSIRYCVRPTGAEPFVLLLRDRNNQLRAIFPMSVVSRQCHGRTARVLTHAITTHNSDVDKPYPIIHKDFEAECWRLFADYFKTRFSDWDWLEYDELIPESALNGLLHSLFTWPKFWARQTQGPVSPIVDLSIGWKNFWTAHRNMRKKYRRMANRLGENFNYQVLTEPHQMKIGLDHYIAVERLGWKAGKGISNASVIAFYQPLLVKLAHSGQAFVGILYDGNTPISVELTLTYHDQVYFAHGTYHPDYQHLSPGSVSTSRFLEYFFDKTYREGDFLAGFAHYLNPWASSLLATQNTIVYKINGLFIYFAMQRLWLKIKTRLGLVGRKR
jgi:hypothetical protein